MLQTRSRDRVCVCIAATTAYRRQRCPRTLGLRAPEKRRPPFRHPRRRAPEVHMTKVTAKKISYVSRLSHVEGLPAEERARLEAVAARFAFRANSYYLGLIDWDDPDDPIRRIIIPRPEELEDWGRLDASNEYSYTVVPGCEHKYEFTGLLLVNDLCGGYCRFCFRKRLFMRHNVEVQRDIEPGIDYIRRHPKINNVLLTGGWLL